MIDMNKSRSPMDLRDDLEHDVLEPYQPPRMLVRQAKVDQANDSGAQQSDHGSHKTDSPTSGKWLSKLLTNKGSNDLQYKRIAHLSSLGSTQSSSSMETDQAEHSTRPRQTMPLISITSNDSATGDDFVIQQRGSTESQRRDYYGRPSNYHRGVDGDEEDDDEDAFEDAPLPMPYSSSSMARTVVVRQQTDKGISYPTTLRQYEDLLDDRQGMNNSEQHFTKAEQANRPSLDGSIINEFRIDPKKIAGAKGEAHKKDKRRSKSPSSSSVCAKKRQSRRGLLGLASRLKLTKKHEPIAKVQLSILNSGFVSLKTLDRDLQSFLPRERLSVKEFQARVSLMRKYEVLSTIEYRFASKYETYVCKHAQHETNRPKNNYKKCIPYDYNRVVLKTLPNVPDSDYINASHVDSCLKPNAYIAAQGPNENTIEDFWRMIWEQKTFVIVMLTKVFDFIRVMCNQYWPVEVNKSERYGNIEVTLLYEEPLADFVIRTIKITKLKRNLAQTNDQSIAPTTEQQSVDEATNIDNNGNNKSNQLVSESEDELEYSDDTSGSEELKLNDWYESSQNLTVREPKFVATKTRRSRKASLSPRRLNSVGNTNSPYRSNRSASAPRDIQRDPNRTEGNKTTTTSAAIKERPKPPNEFLHPFFNSSKLATSSNSLASEPNTPITPRTPSSAGLDRSSATRKAVKKKRRERVKNQRPKQTQFMVPSESQLIDDEDDDIEDQTGDGAGTEAAGKSASERIIYQFHYNSWASHTCPFISSLLHFRRRVRICMDEMSKSGRTGPTVVHCNDGCGRTGTYLCIDANLELAEEDNVIDIYNYTKKMRQSRKFLIENFEQYKFVHDTIEEAIYCGKTWFPVSELHKRLKHKSQRNPITRKNEYLLEYEKICRMTAKFSIGDCAGGHRVENREKNRDVSTVPPDNFRPYLTSFQTNDSTDYINAVFVDGYTRGKEYIVTEWPSHRTISDFWSLIYDHDCNSVILLANPGESSNYPSFLPSEKELRRRFGPVFSAEMVSYTHYQNIKSWIYTINKKIVSLTEVIAGVKSEAKTTQVFQITCWPQGHRVPTSTNALVELMNMVERWRQRTTYGPVCVVSQDGKSRAGVYCAANVAIEQVVQHSEVDVFNAVKTVRRHRPQLVENMTEYKYCYDLILHYVLHYVNNHNQSPTSN